ncbi:hypothetical protein ABZ914_04940 [Spirillospora sp. NPDC046719]
MSNSNNNSDDACFRKKILLLRCIDLVVGVVIRIVGEVVRTFVR